MSFDTSALPITPTTILTGAIFAAAMGLIIGPAIIDRELARDGWFADCQAQVQRGIRSKQVPTPPNNLPLVCSILGEVSPDLAHMCHLVPDPNAQLRRAEAARVAAAVAGIDDHCVQAAERFKAEQMLPIALYAGTGRIVTPSVIKNRDALLSRSLRTSGAEG